MKVTNTKARAVISLIFAGVAAVQATPEFEVLGAGVNDAIVTALLAAAALFPWLNNKEETNG